MPTQDKPKAQTGKPILDALIGASESFAEPKAGERTQHTPGPWHNSGFRVYSDKMVICLCDTYQTYSVEAQATYEANARLIAAAPDLLEVLNSILAEVERLRPDAPSRTMAFHACAPELRHFIKVKARAAIAKATEGITP